MSETEYFIMYELEYYIHFFIYIAVFTAAALPVLIFCLTKGANPGRHRLRLSLLLLGGVILLRFGGEYVLFKLGMGWRCTPRYTMESLIWVLIIVSVAMCFQAFNLPKEKSPTPALAWVGSFISLLASVAVVTVLMLGLSLDRLYESVPTVNGQPVVKESRMNGGAIIRYYLPVNSLVHGQELEYDWHAGLVQLPNGEWADPYNS